MKKILMLLSIVAIFAIGAAYMLINKIDKLEITETDMYQYLSGTRYTYNGNLQISRQDDKTFLYNNGKKFSMDSDPIYYTKENKLILPKDMVLVSYDDGRVQKINHFNSISVKDHKYYVNVDGKDTEIRNSFLFDGADTYLFLDNLQLKHGEVTYNLTPLSYVTFVGNSDLTVYIKEINEIKQDSILNETVTATSNHGYKVDLNSDSLTYNDKNTKQLLPKNFDGLVKFE